MRGAARILGVVLVVAAVGGSAGAASVDVGGTFFNLSGVGNSSGTTAAPGSSAGFVQEDVLKGWFQAAFNDNLVFNAQVGGTFDTAPALPFNTTLYYTDVDLLNLRGTYQFGGSFLTLLRFTVGRLPLADFTTDVLSSRVDGVFLDLESSIISLNVGAGYTGLLAKGSSTIQLSKSDLNDFENTSVIFASPRLIEQVQAALLSIPGQRIIVSAVLQQDLRGTSLDLADSGGTSLVSSGGTTVDLTRGGPVNTQYFGLGMNGSILGAVYYDFFSYLETGQMLMFQSGSYQNTNFLGLLAGGGARLFLPSVLSSVIAVHALYASGDANASSVTENVSSGFSVFTPITRPAFDNVFSPQLSNLIVLEASYSLKPFSKLGLGLPEMIQTAVQADAYFRPTSGGISEPGLATGSSSPYVGTEVDLTVNFSASSDLGTSLWGGLFFPGAAFESGAGMQFKAGLNVSLNF